MDLPIASSIENFLPSRPEAGDDSLSERLRTQAEGMESDAGYESARRKFLSRKPVVLQNHPQTYPPRKDLHDRASLR